MLKIYEYHFNKKMNLKWFETKLKEQGWEFNDASFGNEKYWHYIKILIYKMGKEEIPIIPEEEEKNVGSIPSQEKEEEEEKEEIFEWKKRCFENRKDFLSWFEGKTNKNNEDEEEIPNIPEKEEEEKDEIIKKLIDLEEFFSWLFEVKKYKIHGVNTHSILRLLKKKKRFFEIMKKEVNFLFFCYIVFILI